MSSHYVRNDRLNASADDVAEPERSKSYCRDGNDQTDDSHSLVPACIGELEVLRIGACAIEDTADNAKDVDCCDDDAGCCNDGAYAMESVGVLERTYKHSHLCNESAETRKSEVGKTGNNVTG